MSATGRGTERDKLDRYYTSDTDAAACVACLTLPNGARVVEPSVGGGAFARAVYGATGGRAHILGIDIDPDADGLHLCDEMRMGDFDRISEDLTEWDADIVLGNPPYTDAIEHVRAGLRIAPRVAFLLRLNLLGSIRRAQFWVETPLAAVHVLTRRPSFTGGGTDATDYGFFVWDKAHQGPPGIFWIAPGDLL